MYFYIFIITTDLLIIEVLLDVMNIELESLDIITGERVCESACTRDIPIGSYYIKRKGGSLLKEKCHLKLQVERNLMRHVHIGKFILIYLITYNISTFLQILKPIFNLLFQFLI